MTASNSPLGARSCSRRRIAALSPRAISSAWGAAAFVPVWSGVAAAWTACTRRSRVPFLVVRGDLRAGLVGVDGVLDAVHQALVDRVLRVRRGAVVRLVLAEEELRAVGLQPPLAELGMERGDAPVLRAQRRPVAAVVPGVA